MHAPTVNVLVTKTCVCFAEVEAVWSRCVCARARARARYDSDASRAGPAAVAAVDPEGRYGEGDVDDALAAREADLALYREAQARSRPVSRPGPARSGPARPVSRPGLARLPARPRPFTGPGRAGSRFSVRVPVRP